MIGVIIVLLIILWLLGYIQLPFIPNFVLFQLNGHPITLWNLLIFFLIVWALGILPSPFREIGAIILILWVLSILGIIAIAGLSQILIIAVIAGLILSLFA